MANVPELTINYGTENTKAELSLIPYLTPIAL